MKWENIWSILKWVVVVFLAGFIGYFGKLLAKKISRRLGSNADNSAKAEPAKTTEDLDYKLEKKKLKLEKKRLKKSKD